MGLGGRLESFPATGMAGMGLEVVFDALVVLARSDSTHRCGERMGIKLSQ